MMINDNTGANSWYDTSMELEFFHYVWPMVMLHDAQGEPSAWFQSMVAHCDAWPFECCLFF